MFKDKLLGFDVRELWLDPDYLWDKKRRDTFLIRPDLPKPLSTDTMVWPSVFDTGQGCGLPDSERERLGLAGLPVPSWIGPNAGLWENLPAMRQYLANNWAEPRPHAMIAVSWYSDKGFTVTGGSGPYAEATVPALRAAGWRFLGFDVGDSSLLSGLSNCGYSPLDLTNLRPYWGAHLNTRHLFADLARAFEFRDLANAQVPEHVPFFVYGLHLVGEISWLWVREGR